MSHFYILLDDIYDREVNMNKKVDLSELDAETLYRLAREKEQEEERARVEANKERIKELKAERKALLQRQAEELQELDAELQELTGTKPSKTVGIKKEKRLRVLSSDTISARLVEMIQVAGEMHTQDIRTQADDQGIPVKNLSQTLAYLKRTGRLDSPRRGVYTVAA